MRRAVHAPLALAARHARLVLILGLLIGVTRPGLAAALAPFIGEMVAALLFLAALRIGPSQAFGALSDLRRTLLRVALLQLVLPLTGLAFLVATGALATAAGLGLTLMLAAAPISGSPHLAVMTGNDPASALRHLILGTALLPLTVIPVFWLTPALGSPLEVAEATGALLALIMVSAGAAFAIRASLLRDPSVEAVQAIDGVSALAMAIVVVGLMSAVGPALLDAPLAVALMLGFVFAANITLQVAATLAERAAGRSREAAAIGIVAGNRNIALFLSVLPAETMRDLLLFIGCYQVPMYMTPVLLGRFYGRR